MATKDAPSGLLARVAGLVRSPPADSPSRGAPDAPDEGETGKQAIKRMIARKAHNDAVRQREFSQLRKLREASPAALSEMAERASFYQDTSGFAVSEGRQSTLKKIDEIEAQMSKQWWKGQQGQAAATVPATTIPSPPTSPSPEYVTGASQLDTCVTFAATMPTNLSDAAMTVPGDASMGHLSASSSEKGRGQTAVQVGNVMMSTDFSSASLESIDMGEVLSDPVLEDAAIRFANSDDAGAESVLTMALQGAASSQAAKDTWIIALLDMYRSTGQQASFDRLAAECAHRSGRVARSLMSEPKPTDGDMPTQPAAQPSVATAGLVAWRAPVVLDKPSVDQLRASISRGQAHIVMNWQSLKIIKPEAAEALSALTEQWCEQSLTLQLESFEMLDELMRVNTPVGDQQVPRFWWHLRMNVLRVLGLQDEFELVSMDYCITYEVSPPAWQSARCRRVYGPPQDAEATQLVQFDNPEITVGIPLTEATPLVDANANRIELVGDVLGTDAGGLKSLQSALQMNGDLLVSCERLVRVDFSAAGSILNWVASAQARGKNIEFSRLPHLVAAFFNLIGINEHARVAARVN